MMEGLAGHSHKVAADEAASSSSISSAPNSPPHQGNAHDNIHVARFSGGGVLSATPAPIPNTPAQPTNGNTSTTTTTSASNGTATEKPKRQRKPKLLDADGNAVVDEKPKKTRKPREPKAKAVAAPGEKTAPARTRKVKPEDKPAAHDSSAQPRQPTITETFSATAFQPHQQPPPPATSNTPTPQPPSFHHKLSDTTTSLSGLPPSMHTYTAPPRPLSSGQNYDPIRGSTKEYVPPRPSNPPTAAPSAQASPHINRASASPAIASLIDPPMVMNTSAPSAMHSPQTIPQPPFVLSQQSPTPQKTTSTFAPPPMSSPNFADPSVSATMDGAMDIDPKCRPPPPDDMQIKKTVSKSSSPAPTPKHARPTPPPPAPMGTGSGLLSTSDLFGGPSTSEPFERKGVNIDIQIKLNPAGGNTVNIAQEIIKKYGRDAINPRAAAHREQLLRIAAEQNKFADGTGDDMSVDLTSDQEDNSNVEMGGMDEEKSNTGLETDAKPIRRRKRKVEEYDKEDDFIDDTELAWQEQAAVAKDGFFVYSGPLIPEGQEPQIESAAPTRGRGSRSRARGGRAAASGTTHASLADKTRDATTTRGRTRGTRGTGAPRKPRITKADRERMENEKIQREREAVGLAGPTQSTLAPPTATHMPAAQQPMQMQPPAPHHQTYTQPMGSMV